jgi:hypothetical protein
MFMEIKLFKIDCLCYQKKLKLSSLNVERINNLSHVKIIRFRYKKPLTYS